MRTALRSWLEFAACVVLIGVGGSRGARYGDALGSCLFNLAILAVVDVVPHNGSFHAEASRIHVLSAAFGIGIATKQRVGSTVAASAAASPTYSIASNPVSAAASNAPARRPGSNWRSPGSSRYSQARIVEGMR